MKIQFRIFSLIVIFLASTSTFAECAGTRDDTANNSLRDQESHAQSPCEEVQTRNEEEEEYQENESDEMHDQLNEEHEYSNQYH